MQHCRVSVVRPNLIKLASLAAVLVIVSCCMSAGAMIVEIRGTPGSVDAGSTMHLDGFNFPELIYRKGDNQTYEWLNISFAANGTINEGDASYKTKLYKKSPEREIMFMGSKYHSLNPDKADLLSKIFKDFGSYDKKILLKGEVWELDQNYTLTLTDIDTSNDRLASLELAKNGDVVETAVTSTGGIFEYNADVEGAKDVTIFVANIDSIFGNNVILKKVKHYSDVPLILKTGDKFGNFKITTITNDTIKMKSSNTISCSLDNTIGLLDSWLKLRVSDKGYWGYVYSEKTLECPECPECPEAPIIDESTDANSTAHNSTTSNNIGTGSTVLATTPTATATPEQTTTFETRGASNSQQTLPGFSAVSLFCMFIILIIIRRNKK